MNELILRNENVEFMGQNIPVVEGGFGESCRVLTAHMISKIHNIDVKRINELTTNNLDEFEEGIDILNLLKDGSNDLKSLNEKFNLNMSYSTKYFYIYSEQGYLALVSLMKTEKSKEIRKEFRRKYFAMKSVIKQIQLTVEEMVIMQAQSVMALKDEVKIVKEDVEELKQISSTTTIESYKQGVIQREVAKRVYDRLDKNPNVETRKMFANLHRDLKRKFGVPSYKDIRKVDYEDALVFIHSWIEDRY